MFRVSLSTFGFLVFTIALPRSVVAQNTIVPDGTLGNESSIVQTQTFPTGTLDAITGGATRDGNLFHSFSQFNIGDGLSAGFLITPQIQNIFARVTGNSLSNIQGTIGTRINNNGTLEASQANLFLLNPNGIVFGPNARLSLAGSFMATTASGVRFGDGQVFDAVNPQPAPILAVNVPLGLQFGQRAGNIEVNGATLRNSFGKTLSLLGGNVQVQRGDIGGFAGQVNIGAVGVGEVVGLRLNGEYWGIDYANVRNFQDIQFQNSRLLVGASNAANRQLPVGNLFLQGRSIDIGSRSLVGSTYSNLNQVSADAGVISLNASDRINLTNGSFIGAISSSNVPTANIVVNTGLFNIADSAIVTGKEDQAGGDISIRARNSILVQNSSQIGTSNESQNGAIGSQVSIETPILEIRDGSFIQTRLEGIGRAGNINIQIGEQLLITGEDPTEPRLLSSIATNVRGTPASLTRIRDDAISRTGDIAITAKNVSLQDGGNIVAISLGGGLTGQIAVRASDRLEIADTGTNVNSTSGISNFLASENINGNQSDNIPGIIIQAKEILLKGGGTISTSSFANADSRSIVIDVKGGVIVQGATESFSNPNDGSRIFPARSEIKTNKTDGIGNSGNINIRAGYVQVLDGGEITTSLSKGNPNTRNQTTPFNVVQGKAGDITIEAQDYVLVDGQNLQSNIADVNFFTPSAIISEVGALGNGRGGNIVINTGDVFVKSGGQISSSTDSQGDAGSVEVNARGHILLSGEGRGAIDDRPTSNISSSSNVQQLGNAGTVRVNANTLIVEDGAGISSGTSGAGDAGRVVINVRENFILTGVAPSGQPSRVSSSSVAQTPAQRAAYIQRITSARLFLPELLSPEVATGNAGVVEINAGNLNISDGAEITTRSDGTGRAGDIQISLRDQLTTNNGSITTRSDQTAGGSIQVNARGIRLFGDSDIQSNVASGAGSGGSIDLTARSILAFDDSDILAFARDGRGGDIRLNTSAFFAENYQPRLGNWDGNQLVDLNASGAISGIILFPDSNYVQNSLNPLNQNVIDPNQLIAKTCIRRSRNSQGSLYVLGAGGLPDRPGDIRATQYPTGDVRDLSPSIADKPWQKGDPIVEPQGAYQLANGEWVLSQECGV